MTTPVLGGERPSVAALRPSIHEVVLYGDFNCPWSYLASRRVALLVADGARIDWRAVEHHAPRRRTASASVDTSGSRDENQIRPVRLGSILEEMRQVLTLLLPGEQLPYALAGFAPHTNAAVAAYAEAYRAGVAGPMRRVLFEALWLHGFDLGDSSVVHTLVVDAVRSGVTGVGPLSSWDYGSGATHQVGATTQLLLDAWTTEWGEGGNQTVPMLVAGGEPFHGVDALGWLGAELLRRGLFPDLAPQAARSLPALA